MRALSKLVNLKNPDRVLFVGEALVGNDVVDQLSKFNQLLDEMIDNGFPLTTEPNILREMIAPPNIVNKMLSVVTCNSSNMSDTLPGPTSSCIPWRTADPKYANNEVYVDLVEEMDAIVKRDGVRVKCEIYGEVKVNSHLSGVPDLTLSFANPSILDDVRFHPCLRFRPRESQQILSFVPLDGQFKLMSYRCMVLKRHLGY
ncbi:AP-3 complex subunit mu-like [Prunus avium]|uniref:AP-3 complex subunit mu-like n=1 Tax=Prunus avium TaxID=42229 RepID=A0A6P5SRF9_PRUAV|nr:AP-3 complex subunit mu-like [Prunus avium]